MITTSRLAASLAIIASLEAGAFAATTLLNVSSDATREFYQEINKAFSEEWKKQSGEDVRFRQSHGGSGKQTRAVIDGLEADVVTLAVGHDIEQLEKAGLIPAEWKTRLANNGSPFTSTIVLVVRKGNPKNIKTWDDLARPGVQVITASPKTSGGARLNYLAIWGYALRKFNNDEGKVREFVAAIYGNVPVLDSGARGATSTFAQRGIGDVLITWENEAHLALKEFKDNEFQIITPALTVAAEPPVAVVDKYAKKHGTEAVAGAYLKFLYSPAGQDIAARHYFRPRLPEVAGRYADRFGKSETFTVDEVFGGWSKAQKAHFDDGGTFDQIYKNLSEAGGR